MSDNQNRKQERGQKEEQLNGASGVPPKRRRGRPEKPLKIKDTPENVARALFGLPPIRDDSR